MNNKSTVEPPKGFSPLVAPIAACMCRGMTEPQPSARCQRKEISRKEAPAANPGNKALRCRFQLLDTNFSSQTTSEHSIPSPMSKLRARELKQIKADFFEWCPKSANSNHLSNARLHSLNWTGWRDCDAGRRGRNLTGVRPATAARRARPRRHVALVGKRCGQ
jgi:hypothetical protein